MNGLVDKRGFKVLVGLTTGCRGFRIAKRFKLSLGIMGVSWGFAGGSTVNFGYRFRGSGFRGLRGVGFMMQGAAWLFLCVHLVAE